ncbi:hypothetical protein BAUCODRAFT_148951 [Baudoinia panamericana UAMH 10762]|uniref:Uncharacterized protein n=1 Tax=Baudoinia panamericana (strain UAMH 10762) TaxID=717646 RepID=M2MX50_BAUPA|nr:uncharacterized protein BAUCODRAFT_148951 [Baudoinia panamericana UAMH 10762]EMC96123.1 hypothetical protein BAUCODRAFT_148951 [Baudoinia panamericana UAMH 10762]
MPIFTTFPKALNVSADQDRRPIQKTQGLPPPRQDQGLHDWISRIPTIDQGDGSPDSTTQLVLVNSGTEKIRICAHRPATNWVVRFKKFGFSADERNEDGGDSPNISKRFQLPGDYQTRSPQLWYDEVARLDADSNQTEAGHEYKNWLHVWSYQQAELKAGHA